MVIDDAAAQRLRGDGDVVGAMGRVVKRDDDGKGKKKRRREDAAGLYDG